MGATVLTQKGAEAELDLILASVGEVATVELKEYKQANVGKALVDELGKYLSAISNAVTLCNANHGWLISGVRDDRTLVGTQMLPSKNNREEIMKLVGDATTDRITFADVFEISRDGKRLLMFLVPASPGTVVKYKGFAYGRDGPNCVPLSDEKSQRIQGRSHDWSAELMDLGPEALDMEAVAFARAKYVERSPHMAEESASWSDEEFLSRLSFTMDGKITHSAAILLGTEKATFQISAMTEIRYIVKEKDGELIDFHHLKAPFLLSAEKVYNSIFNPTYRRLMDSLSTEVMPKYDIKAIREGLNNGLMHNDYRKGTIIDFIEFLNDRIVISNRGSFIPGSVESAVLSVGPVSYYRNPHLAEIMVKLGLVETVGTGMRKMFLAQAFRYFPLPEYEIDDDHVSVTITGHPVNDNFGWALLKNPDLSFSDVMLLDNVQKGKTIPDDDAERLVSANVLARRDGTLYLPVLSMQRTEPTRPATSGKGGKLNDLHPTERAVYDVILHSDGLTMKEVSDRSSVSIRTAYRVANTLAERGLVGKANRWGGKWVVTENHDD
ncbi:MAG: putative DNA binding domain-containing protein [Candidatus Methanoplasma sp.]|jgi:ATP-dependent DNA helicase RecG|nr:putative DNA binding domain-containing protein [Candidatus Methanoplasma sp.]